VQFLIDAQLPPALARSLEAAGHDAVHVADVGLLRADDPAIWEHASVTGAALITKDEDFVTMRALKVEDGPAIIWVRIGNSSKRVLIERFSAVFAEIVDALRRGETVIQVSDR
jgi:predicted nuclease of predicted toxin-antitoxin system